MLHKWEKRGMHIGYWWEGQTEWGGIDLTDMAQDREWWWVLVNLWVP
jgi:hypothetical protein